MGTALTRDQVLALAPDDSSAKAASGLTSDSKWVTLGADDAAVWGECQGSGSKPYQAQVDLDALVSRCSCPSRKFPCKHGLALLLLFAQNNPRFTGAARPAWVDEWLASRRDRAEKKEKAAETQAAKVAADPAAAAAGAAKREQTRWKRIEAGTGELERWIGDQFRRGLARFGAEQRAEWSAMAARMVDAQAPGLAPRVQALLDHMQHGAQQHGDVIEGFGLLQLINEGVRRREQLSPARLADLRAALGWAADKEDAAAAGEAVADRWCVLGQIVLEPDTKLRERRVWLRGIASGRYALLQDFAYGAAAWERTWRHAAVYAATLRFFPGSAPLRALADDVVAEPDATPWPADTATAAFDAVSTASSNNPWLAHWPVAIDAATPVHADDAWWLQTDAGTLPLQLDTDAGWSLLAFTGGHAVAVMGEWSHDRFRLLSARDATGAHWTAGAAA